MSFARSSLFRILYLVGFLSFALLSLPSDAASLPFRWPWIGLFQISIGITLITALGAFLRSMPSRSTVAGRIFSSSVFLLLFAWSAAAFFSNYPDRAWSGLLIPAGAISLGYLTNQYLKARENMMAGIGDLSRIGSVLAFLIFTHGLELWYRASFLPLERFYARINEALGEPLFQSAFFEMPNPHPFGHANYTAGVSVLLIPLLFTAALRERKGWRYFYLFTAGLGIIALWSSDSRAGGGVFLLTILAAGICFLLEKKATRRQWIRLTSMAVCAVLALAFLHPGFRSVLLHFPDGLSLSFADSERLNLFRTGWKIGASSPLWGVGPGATSIVYPTFWSGSGKLSNAFQLHSTPLQVWADLGLLGVLGFLSMGIALAAIAFQLRREAERRGDPALSLLNYGLGISLMAYSLFSFADYQLDVYFISGILAIVTGIYSAVHSRYTETGGEAPSPSLLWHIPSFLAGATAIFFLWKEQTLWQSRRCYAEGLRAYQAEDASGFETALLTASAWSPSDAFYLNRLGWGLENLARQAQNRGERVYFQKKSIGYLKKSLEIQPGQEFCHYNLGWLLLKENSEEALNHFKRAAEINPGKRGVYFGLALALKKTGKDRAAIRALGLECLSMPVFIAYPLWEDPAFKAVEREVKEELWQYYEKVWGVPSFQPIRRHLLEEALAISRWWWREKIPPREPGPGESVFLDWLEKTRAKAPEGNSPKPVFSQPVRASDLVFAAWKWPRKRTRFLKGAYLETFNREPARGEIELLGRYLKEEGRSFSELLRGANQSSLPPLEIYRNRRPALGLLSRNLDGPVVEDFFLYEQNLFLEMALNPLFPRRGYLPGAVMRGFLETLF